MGLLAGGVLTNWPRTGLVSWSSGIISRGHISAFEPLVSNLNITTTDTIPIRTPQTAKAAVDGRFVVREVPTQAPGGSEVLVGAAVIGISPTDWKGK